MTSKESNRVLVIGAGELGSAMLTQLASHPLSQLSGTTISVLLRPSTISTQDSNKRKEIEKLATLGVTMVPGDLQNDSMEDLAGKLSSFTTVIGCTGMTGGTGLQTKIAHAVLKGKVARYIPWQFGVDYDVIGPEAGNGLFREQCEIRTLLRGQMETDWKIVSTGMFLSFIFEEDFGVVVGLDNGGCTVLIRALGGLDNQITLTDVQDIGRCTAEIVWRWEEIEEQIIFIASETIYYRQLASPISSMGGMIPCLKNWTIPYLREELAKDPEDPIKKYRVVFAEGKGVAWPKETSFNVKRGIKTMSLQEGVERYLKV